MQAKDYSRLAAVIFAGLSDGDDGLAWGRTWLQSSMGG
jgi:hypothetical protein